MEDEILNKFAELLEEFAVQSKELEFSENKWPNTCEREEEWCNVLSAAVESPSLANVVHEALSNVIFTAIEPYLQKFELALFRQENDTDAVVYALINLYIHYVRCNYMLCKWSEILGRHELKEKFHSRLRVFLLREEMHASLPVYSLSPYTWPEISSIQGKEFQIEQPTQREQLYAKREILKHSRLLPSLSTTGTEHLVSCRDLLISFAYTHARKLLLSEKHTSSDIVDGNSINCSEEEEEEKMLRTCQHNRNASCHGKCYCLLCQVDYVWVNIKNKDSQWTSFLLQSPLHNNKNKVSACVIYMLCFLTLCTSEDMKSMWLSLLKECITYELYTEETENQELEEEECCKEKTYDDSNGICLNTGCLRKHMEWLVQTVYPFTELIFSAVDYNDAFRKAGSIKESQNQYKCSTTAQQRRQLRQQECEHLRFSAVKSRTNNQTYMCRRWLLDELLIEFAHKQLSAMWDIIIEFPDSLATVKDLRYCIRHTSNHFLKKEEITITVQDVLASRLHKAGTRTEDIVSVLNKTIEMLSLLVERNEWSSFVYRIIHPTLAHLQRRQDCVATIVKAITETDKSSTIYSNNVNAIDIDQEDMDITTLINNTDKLDKECNFVCYSHKGTNKHIEEEQVATHTLQSKLEMNLSQKEYLEEEEEEEYNGEYKSKIEYANKQKTQNKNVRNVDSDRSESDLFRSYDDIKNDMECITEGERDRAELESSRPPDVLHILLSTLSAKVIAEEYKHALATQLLSKHFNNFDVTIQEEVLERLKCVLGELALSSCTIMLHDMQSSRRLTTQLREHIKLHQELSEEARTNMSSQEHNNNQLAKEKKMSSLQSKRNDNNLNIEHTSSNAEFNEKKEQHPSSSDDDDDDDDNDSFIGRRTVCLDSSYVVPSSSNIRDTFDTKKLSSLESSSLSPQHATFSVLGMHGGNLQSNKPLRSLPQPAECHVLEIDSIDVTVISATAWPARVVHAGYAAIPSINNELSVNKNMTSHIHTNDITCSNKNRLSAGSEKTNSTAASFHIHPLLLNEMNKLNRAYRAIKAMRKLEWMHNYGCIEMEITQVEACTNTPVITTVELSLFEASVVLYVQDAENDALSVLTQHEEEHQQQQQQQYKESKVLQRLQQEHFRGVPVEQLSTCLGVSVEELMLRVQPLLLHVLQQTEHGISLQPCTSESSNIILAQVDNKRNSVNDEEQVSTSVLDNGANTHTQISKSSIAGLSIDQIKLLQTMITAMLKAGGAKSVNDIYNSMKLFGQFQGSVGDMRKVLQHLLTINAIVLSADGKNYCLPSK